MKIFFQILFLEFFMHPWNLHKKFKYSRNWFIWEYNDFYHKTNNDIIRWRKRQIYEHKEMLCKQDQIQKLLRERDLACKNDVNATSKEYPDLLFYQHVGMNNISYIFKRIAKRFKKQTS